MRTSDFEYHLPDQLIAQKPLNPRNLSRMMVVSRPTNAIQHDHFKYLPEILRPDDLLVLNNSRVLPARLYGRRTDDDINIELLLIDRQSTGTWRALTKPGRRMIIGTTFQITVPQNENPISGEVLDIEADGTRIIRLSQENLDKVGVMPLPPYIHEPLIDQSRYQTVYAKHDGSIAAPTAGLHFTHSTLSRLGQSGVEIIFVTLHVGRDSFRPLRTEDPLEHKIHSEYWELSENAAKAINQAKRDRRRIVAVGTTTTRLLEQAALLSRPKNGVIQLDPTSDWANLFILPGHKFKIVDALITNFHLPKSTLLMLTCAFGGRDLIFRAYSEAVQHQYRFYSFGDCMLIQ